MIKDGALKPIKTWNYTSESSFYVANEVDEIQTPMLGFYGTQIAVQWKPNHLAKIMECKNGGVAPDIELVGIFVCFIKLRLRSLEMITSIKIQRTQTAPRPSHRSARTSQWRALFNTMKVGDWFVVDKQYHSRLCNAGQLYLKGKYSLYKHPEQNDQYIFLRQK